MANLNELKPEDVMKALECCTFTPKCEECPLGGEGCITLDQHALALLREKDAEIARLTEENERLRQSRSILAPIRGFTAEEIDQIAKEMVEVNE